MHCATEVHLNAVKRAVLYIKRAINYGAKCQKSQSLKLVGYSHSDWGSSLNEEDVKGPVLVSAQEFSHGVQEKLNIVPQSTTEAKFVAATAAVNQTLRLRKILVDFHLKQTKVFVGTKLQ